ncbi:hypothetical protein PIB30_084733 [Stylosanthes scabra]|uniref:PB1-like domain-containing protein n=1 Tax=Stylosanthes scabra TaxID=79078 RepID=A0ABU6VSH9_9FABA|nr:hypothetical protein [Stylosanthes scabra]
MAYVAKWVPFPPIRRPPWTPDAPQSPKRSHFVVSTSKRVMEGDSEKTKLWQNRRQGVTGRESFEQMGDTFAPIFYHGGDLKRNPLGELEYVNGMVERFEEMDLDMVNFGDMKKLFEGLGYRHYLRVTWLIC